MLSRTHAMPQEAGGQSVANSVSDPGAVVVGVGAGVVGGVVGGVGVAVADGETPCAQQ